MADIIRDLIIKIAIQQADVKLRAPDIGPILVPFKKFEDKASENVEGVATKVEELGGDISDLKPKLEEISRSSEDATRQLTDDTLKASEGFRTAGEGAFTLARGIAFVGIASEEDLQKVIQTVAKVQGAFDIFKGGIDVVKGLTEGTHALRLVTTSAAVAQGGLARANTAVATTAAVATVSMGTLMAVLGPLALAAAAVGVAFLIFKDAPEDIGNTTEAAEKLRKKLNDIASLKIKGIDLLLEFGDLVPEERIEEIGKRLKAEIGKINRNAEIAIHEQTRILKDLRKRLGEQSDEGLALPDFILQRNEAEEQRRFLISQRELALIEAKAKAGRDLLNIEKSKRDEIKSALDLARQDLQISKDKLALEKGALQTFKERFGALSAVEQVEAKRAARILKEEGVKGLTQKSIDLLERVGGGVGEAAASKSRTLRAELGDVEGFRQDLSAAGRGPLQQFIKQQREDSGPQKFPDVNFQQRIRQAELSKELLEGTDEAISSIGVLEEVLRSNNEMVEKFSKIVKETVEKQVEIETVLDKLNN